jgi:cob(I)alamin adenosyltransferase
VSQVDPVVRRRRAERAALVDSARAWVRRLERRLPHERDRGNPIAVEAGAAGIAIDLPGDSPA